MAKARSASRPWHPLIRRTVRIFPPSSAEVNSDTSVRSLNLQIAHFARCTLLAAGPLDCMENCTVDLRNGLDPVILNRSFAELMRELHLIYLLPTTVLAITMTIKSAECLWADSYPKLEIRRGLVPQSV